MNFPMIEQRRSACAECKQKVKDGQRFWLRIDREGKVEAVFDCCAEMLSDNPLENPNSYGKLKPKVMP